MKKTISIPSFVILITIQGFLQNEILEVAHVTLKVGAGIMENIY